MLKVFVGNNIDRRPVIVSNTATLRSVLEDNEIDYSHGTTSLDGATLGAGDLDKTFAEMGITGEKCYLLNSVKTANAAAIKVLGNTAVVVSAFTPEQVKEVAKYRPEAAQLTTEKGEVTFMVMQGAGDGCINGNGVEFGSGQDSEGKAIVTLRIPDGKDAKEYIEEKVGVAILNLKKVEEKWAPALAEIAAEKAAVLGTIQVL